MEFGFWFSNHPPKGHRTIKQIDHRTNAMEQRPDENHKARFPSRERVRRCRENGVRVFERTRRAWVMDICGAWTRGSDEVVRSPRLFLKGFTWFCSVKCLVKQCFIGDDDFK